MARHHERMYEQYVLRNSSEARNVERWEPHGKYEIKIFLNNGIVELYHNLLCTTRVLFDNDGSDEWVSREFANNLVARMYERGITQDFLAEKIGVTQATIGNYIRQTSIPNLATAMRIAEALNCDIYDLVDNR